MGKTLRCRIFWEQALRRKKLFQTRSNCHSDHFNIRKCRSSIFSRNAGDESCNFSSKPADSRKVIPPANNLVREESAASAWSCLHLRLSDFFYPWRTTCELLFLCQLLSWGMRFTAGTLKNNEKNKKRECILATEDTENTEEFFLQREKRVNWELRIENVVSGTVRWQDRFF